MKFITLGCAFSLLTVMSVSAQNTQLSQIQADGMQSSEHKISSEILPTSRRADIAVSNSGVPQLQKKVVFAPVREAGLTASYKEPAGLLSMGLSVEGDYYRLARRRGGAYIPYTFTNTSTGASSYEWMYWNLSETSDSLISTAADLTFTPGFSYMPLPTLTASNGAEQSVTNGLPAQLTEDRILLLSGGSNIAANEQGDERNWGAMTYPNLWYSEADGRFAINGAETRYPFDDESKESWASAGIADADVLAYGNIFPKPNSPYYITKMWAYVYLQTTSEVSLQLKVYEVTVTDDGRFDIGDVIASGETIVGAGDHFMLDFDLFGIDEDGFETEDPITINTAIYAEISGFNGDENVTVLNFPFGNGSLVEAIPNGTGYDIINLTGAEINAVLRMSGTVQGSPIESLVTVPWYYGSSIEGCYCMISDFFIMTDAVYGWLYTKDSKVVELPKEGGEATFNVNSYWPWESGALKITVPEGQDDSWLEATVAQNGGDLQFTFKADKCDIDEGRKLEIVLEGVGCPDLKFTVNQGAKLAIDGVEVDKDEKAVEYFDVMGRKLNAQPENGMFIRKAVMNDGSVKTAKVIK